MNNTEMGEYIVGAYLKIIKECDFIDYNIREPGGGLAGLDELDVIGLDFHRQVAYLCEVTTHIRGLLYGSGNEETVKRIKQKYEKQQKYAKNHLSFFPAKHFMFWSPVVPQGYITEGLQELHGLEVIINDRYTAYINDLRQKAREMHHDTGNPFFRALQIPNICDEERIRSKHKSTD